jgi:chromodomain-helicase-DNA-binding protein 7
VWSDIVARHRRPRPPPFNVSEVYLLECPDCCEGLLARQDDLDVAFRAAAIHAVSRFPIGPIENLIDDRCPVEDGHDPPVLNETADFWDTIAFEALPGPPRPPTPREWTIHMRNQLARGLTQFGFGRWAAIREHAGLYLPDSEIQAGASILIRLVLDCSPEPGRFDALSRLTQPSNREIPIFAHDSFPDDLAQSTFLKRIDKLFYHPRPVDDSVPHVVRLSAGILNEWWAGEHDRALISLSWNHGLGVFDHIPEMPDGPVRKLESVPFTQLTDRVLQFCDMARKEVLPDDIVIKSLVCEGEKWPPEDQAAAIAHILKFGIERDEDGDPDYFMFMKGSGLVHRTDDDIMKFVEELLYKCDHPETAQPAISYKTAISLTQRVAQMYNIRAILDQDDRDLRAFFASAPKWRNMPKQWTPDHEIRFFRGLSRLGFGSTARILDEQPFSELFEGVEPPSNLLSDESVMKRISVLDDSRRRPKSQAKKPRREREREREREKEPAKATGSGGIPNWDEIWNHGNVRLPLEVRQNSEPLALGHIVSDRPHFHTERYIYPAGYKCTRSFWSTVNADDRVVCVSEIVDTGGPKPLFRVSMEDNPKVSFEGTTTSQPWVLILKAVSAKKR